MTNTLRAHGTTTQTWATVGRRFGIAAVEPSPPKKIRIATSHDIDSLPERRPT